MKLRVLLMTGLLSVGVYDNSQAAVVTFDDLNAGTNISGTTYAGLFWENGKAGYGNNNGWWEISYNISTSSPPKEIYNTWGSTELGIKFSGPVNVSGANFTGGTAPDSNWTKGVRAIGYLNNIKTAETNVFSNINQSPDWFAMNLNNIDRLVIQSQAVNNGGGWYGMDDLTYTPLSAPVPIPGAVWLLGSSLVGLAGLRRRKNL